MKKKTSNRHVLSRRAFLTATGGALSVGPKVAEGMMMPATQISPRGPEEKQPAPLRQKRPAWLREQGIVMAGVDWEALVFRIRAGGNPDLAHAYRSYDEKVALWREEHSERVARRLKQMGFNFAMIPFYKGAGPKAERPGMEDAKRFTEICHRVGLRVGCYTFSGSLLYESFFAENPDARDWIAKDFEGKPIVYGYGKQYFRWMVNRTHPGLRAFLRDIVRFAVVEAKVDLIHLDNYVLGSGYEEYTVNVFRRRLRNKYSPEERKRRFGWTEMECMQPPPAPKRPDEYNSDPVYQDFVDYRCDALADTYRELGEYARSLNPEIIMECNSGGYSGGLNLGHLGIGSLDHTSLIRWGGAFWDEHHPCRLENGIMTSHFRSQLMGRLFGNMLFAYTDDRLSMAESMANNLQCLGAPAAVIGDKVVAISSIHDENPKEIDPAIFALMQFFHREQRHYCDTELIADVGVVNTHANKGYGPQISRNRWLAFTQALYQGKVPFTFAPECLAPDLGRFRVLVLADLALISDRYLKAIREFVRQGGGLVVTGQSEQFNEHYIRREKPGLADLFPGLPGEKTLRATHGKGRVIYLPEIQLPMKFQAGMLPVNNDEMLEAIHWAAGGPLTVEIKAPDTVTMSLYSQPSGRRILHLVNYDPKQPLHNIQVSMQLPQGKSAVKVHWLSPDSEINQTLPAQVHGRELRFTVPRLEVYDLVAIA